MDRINIDFETYSEARLKEVGAHRYAMDKSTDVICLSYSINDAEPDLWYPGLPIPDDLVKAIEARYLVYAWNTGFEFVIWNYVLMPKYNFPAIPFMSWRDTQAIALTFALPMSLEKCAEVLGLFVQKDKRGKYLIQKLSLPQKITRNNPHKRFTKDIKPELHEEMYEYCKQDVRVEMEILKFFPYELTPNELNLWRQTLIKNNRGIPIDIELVDSVVEVTEEYLEGVVGMIPMITGGAVTTINQRAKILAWAESQGYELPDLTADTVSKSLEDPDINNYPSVKQLLEIRSMIGKSSTKKFLKIQEAICEDNRIRDCLKYHKATTGREGGRLLQPQNLPRAEVPNVEETIAAFKTRDLETVMELHENIMYVASAMIRPSICAEEGKEFTVYDYSSIENRVLCWLAGQEDKLDIIVNGLDIYVDMASSLYGLPYEEIYDGYKKGVESYSEMRRHGKLTILGCGYGMGDKKFYDDCITKGFNITREESKRTIDVFRSEYDMVKSFWYGLEDAAAEAVAEPGNLKMYNMIGFIVEHNFLFMILPNGKRLAYYNPRLKEVETPWGAYKMAVVQEGMNPYTNKWGDVTITPGRLAENASQAVSREILMEAQLDCEREGYPIILTVHDELVNEDERDVSKEIKHIMENRCDIYAGLPLNAAGFRERRYRK